MLEKMLKSEPDASARIQGGADNKNLKGTVAFFKTGSGVLVRAEINGLPVGREKCAGSVFAFHIHEGKSCSGDKKMPFADVKGHFNPGNCPHPQHAGDMPPLFADKNGFAWQAFYTTRFSIDEVLGRAVVIHAMPDDFHTQPSGNSGTKIGCGIIRR